MGEHLLAPDLFKIFADEFYSELNRLRMAASTHLEEAKRELAGIDRKTAKLVAAIVAGGPAKALTAELQKLEARQEELGKQLDAADAPPPLIHPALPELYRHKVAGLRESLAEPTNGDETAQIIRSLVESIILTPEDGCQSACKRDPLSARKRDPLSRWRKVDRTRAFALRAA